MKKATPTTKRRPGAFLFTPMSNNHPVFQLVQMIGGTAATSKLTGINPRTIARWQSGESEPSPESVALLRGLADSATLPPFRERIKAARDAAGFTQAQAAAFISPLLSLRTLQSWEAQDGPPPFPWVQDLVLARLALAAAPGAGE